MMTDPRRYLVRMLMFLAVVVAIAALLLGEPMGRMDVVGVAIITAGILAVQLSRMPARPPR